ncbi:right-handed parallel beta-helix repeat-containing protein [Mucilaginibacter daejeonensis]|uniref:glycoside hydrolase family 28 protein n=1 Tax=Mucilaginibacter daejeonensis TaxID=398049 RepID=UPI001D1749E4|nr:glycosyl hydrolase family 28 protein [Mucilaginibacter daejeonensis]UEG52484.1 right-handed parallel beta-helix repeat-containing protein [Mucilaginibacter daejeonensis]
MKILNKMITLAVMVTGLGQFNYAGTMPKPSTDLLITDFGAKSDPKTDNAAAIQRTIDACSKAGGGKVIVPKNQNFMTGPFELRSNIELVVEAGACVIANPDESIYKKSAFKENVGEGTIWIGGHDLKNVTFSGSGCLDGNGVSFMGAPITDSYILKPFDKLDPRPHLLTIIGGSNIRFKDLTVRNSAYWTLHLIGCNDVTIDNITLLNDLKVRNSDGIDLDHCKNVRISNCYIESGDDCICLKNRREYEEFGPCQNIVVNNCTMTSRSCAIKIGSENMDSIDHVVISNCIIRASNRGIGIQNRDEGTVSDVQFNNILIESHLFTDVWWGKAEPIYVTAYARANANNKDANWRFPKGVKEGKVGKVSRIYFSGIKATSENGVYVGAESADKITDIYFDQVDLHINKTTANKGGVYDRRPAKVEGLLTGSTSGFYLENAGHVVIRNSSVQWGANKPDYFKHAIESHNVQQLDLSGFMGTSAFPGKWADVSKN